jgi:nitroreductase
MHAQLARKQFLSNLEDAESNAGNSMVDALSWRYAVKQFDQTKRISDADWSSLETALVLSPSAYGLQPWRFLVVQNPYVRKELADASWGQSQVESCSHFIVFCSKSSVDAAYIDEFVREMARTRFVSRESLEGYYQMVVSDLINGPKSTFTKEWAARQAYIALGTLLTAAATMRIDSCPMEGIDNDKYDSILNLESQGYRALAACALGYRSQNDKYAHITKVRFNKDRVIQFI